jgi:hypothetical protein
MIDTKSEATTVTGNNLSLIDSLLCDYGAVFVKPENEINIKPTPLYSRPNQSSSTSSDFVPFTQRNSSYDAAKKFGFQRGRGGRGRGGRGAYRGRMSFSFVDLVTIFTY